MFSHKNPQSSGGWYRNVFSRALQDRHLADSDVAALTYGSEFAGPVTGATYSSALAWARGHIDICEACRERAVSARAQDAASAALLVALDVPAPSFDVAPVLARARTSPPDFEYTIRPKLMIARRTRRYTMAASAVFAMIGVTALAFPGSPLRKMMQRVATTHHPERAPEAVRPTATSREIRSSVAIAPSAHLAIEFSGAAVVPPVLTVRYCDTAFASLRIVQTNASHATSGPSLAPDQPARFTVSTDRIVVTRDNSDVSGAAYELMVPDSTRELTITANGKSAKLLPRHHSGPHRNSDSCDPPNGVSWTP